MRRGFTLVELSLVLVVVGLMVAFGLTVFGGSNSAACTASTQQQLATIEAALHNFAATHARMPKPARMDLGSSDPQFGYEAMGAITDPNDAVYATDAPAGGVTNTGGVLIGALPHVALGLPSENAADCWGNKFTYAVTNALTSNHPTAGYPGLNVGAITMRSGTLGSPQPLSNTISFAVISHGEDAYGATPMSAGNMTPRHCNGSSEPKIDRENCNNDVIFYNSTPNTGDQGQYFDDLVVFGAKLQSTEPCAAQAQSWMTSCNGNAIALNHGASDVITNTAPGFTGTVTVTCNDTVLVQSAPSCTPSALGCSADTVTWATNCSASVPASAHGYTSTELNSAPGYSGSANVECSNGLWSATSISCDPSATSCASEGLNEGEGNYDAGSCTLTSCCGGTIVTSTPSLCPAASYMAGAGNCAPPPCDNDPSDGLSSGQKYCSGVVINQGGGDYVCSGGIWGASYPFTCNGTQCQSGSASSSITSETSGCPGSPDCSNGDTAPTSDCNESATCTCN